MRFKLHGILLILAAMLLAGCGDSTNPAPTGDTNAANATAKDAAAKMPPPPGPGK